MILDTHLHSIYSDGLDTPELIAKQAKKAGLDGFALTDHDNVAGLERAKTAATQHGLEFIPGIEVSCFEGHVVGLGIDEVIEPASVADVVEKIKDLGGVSVAVHPYDIRRKGIGDLVKVVNLDYIETFNSRTILDLFNEKADKVADELNLKKTSASDSHYFKEVGFGAIRVNSLEDIYKGNVEIVRKERVSVVLQSIETTKRIIRKL